jgi:predicted deacylase
MNRHLLLAAALLASTACRPTTRLVVPPGPSATTPGGPTSAPTAMSDALRIADRYRVAAITTRRINHADYWSALQPSLVSRRLQVEEIGRSLMGRPIRAVTFGTGPATVLLWSQMHGDEATATMALADILAWMTASGSDAVRDRIATALTVTMIPMLNPDGAERFQRENAVGIDINRDARRLSTPEGRALKTLRDKLTPNFGFNLHDQNARTRVGRTGLQAGIALLAPATDADRSWNDVRSRARLVAAGIARDLSAEIPGRVAKYDDSFNPRAFGDLMQTWGTSTVLIESGALPNDPDKQQLRRLNAAAIMRALDAIATKSYESADSSVYDELPFNTGGAYDVLVRGGQIVLPGMAPLVADVGLNYDDAVARTGPRVREVGDLSAVVAIDTIDASGLFLHPRPEALTSGNAAGYLTIGARAAFDLRAGADPQSAIRRRIE